MNALFPSLLAAVLSALLMATPAAAQPTVPAVAGSAPVADTMGQRMQACTVCHGKEGRSTNTGYFPRIAGKPAGYLYNQLVNFRDGRRQNATMTYLMEHMSEAYLREIAGHFASLELPYPPPQPAAMPPTALARGEQLVRQGDAARKLPACNSCHGDAMTGVQPAVPGLLGLPRDYLIGQLGAWRTGLRKAVAPDCMATIAKALNDDDVSIVASWLAAQPLPAAPKAVASLPAPAPMPCGSGQR